jgi:hypothetical protein
MAAPPAKPSPSNQAVQQSDNAVASTDAAAAAAADDNHQPIQLKAPPPSESHTPSLPATTPTYASVEASENFRLAKDLLNAGSFEEALSVVEQELETIKTLLLARHAPETVDLHPSVAPLHYLYGTTLLYSLEESKDDHGQENVAAIHMPQDDVENENEFPSAAAANADPQDEQGAVPEDAEDMEIAWENFEVARAIVEKMLTQPLESPEEEKKLQLYVSMAWLCVMMCVCVMMCSLTVLFLAETWPRFCCARETCNA